MKTLLRPFDLERLPEDGINELDFENAEFDCERMMEGEEIFLHWDNSKNDFICDYPFLILKATIDFSLKNQTCVQWLWVAPNDPVLKKEQITKLRR